MKTKTLVGTRGYVLRWVLAYIFASFYVSLYVWFVGFSNEHSKVGNLGLCFLMCCGAIVLNVAYRVSCTQGHSSSLDREVIVRRATVGFIVLGIWHAVGGLLISSVEAQHWFAYGPFWVFVGVLFLGFMKYLHSIVKSR